MSDPATLETVDYNVNGPIATITLNRPEKLNAFNTALRRELRVAVEAAADDETIRVVILTGAGKAFCSGADLSDKPPEGQTVEERINDEYKPMLLAITHAPKPFIGAINGAAAGIGSALAMACDLLVMGRSAYIYQAFSAIGLIPDGGATWHLSRRLGFKRAYEIMATGEKLNADECLDARLANRVVADGALMEEAQKIAETLVGRAPLSLRYTKEALREAARLGLGDTITMEAALQKIVYASDDYAEGKAAFLEKREPVWKGT